MEQHELGRTGHRSTVLTFGTAGLGRVEQAVEDKAIEAVLEYGVNHIDIDRALWWALSQPVHTAPSAGDVNLLTRVLDTAERFVSLSAEEQDEIVQSQSPPLPEPNLGIPASTV